MILNRLITKVKHRRAGILPGWGTNFLIFHIHMFEKLEFLSRISFCKGQFIESRFIESRIVRYKNIYLKVRNMLSRIIRIIFEIEL